MKVLIVDDRDENRYLLDTMLRGAGCEVQSAANGAEALERLLGAGRFDLIVSDILMPVMDGFQLCRMVKKDAELRRIPFIIYTATYTGPKDEEFALKIGADRFIQKPCEPDAFMRAVSEVLEEAEKGVVSASPEPEDEKGVLKLYNERLVRKLEQKMMQAEKEVMARRETEAALRESEERHRRLFETMPQGVVYQDAEGKITNANPAAERILGLTLAQIQGRTLVEPRWSIIKEDGSEFPGEMHPSMVALRTGRSVKDMVMGIPNQSDGGMRWLKVDAVPLFKHDGEKPHQVYVTFDDITDRKHAEEEKDRLQSQLSQAQKMESIGRLAGGVAHDFNNLLTGIIGNLSIAIMDVGESSPLNEILNEAKQAAESASELTRRLLTFSRKQVVEPKVLNINDVIAGSHKMLKRMVREDIELITVLERNLGHVKADPCQVEQILVNLVVNSRDAMPGGGKVTLETANTVLDEGFCQLHPDARPGRHIMFSVGDTGTGMTDEVKRHLFEPFFTTKEVGKGTGLGLSTVYGVVRQIGGNIEVLSESGKGTKFIIYLPMVQAKPDSIAATNREDMPTGSETIILVEDQKIVMNLAERVLKRQGYRVYSFPNGADAEAALHQMGRSVELLITDIVMPGINGKVLADKVKTVRPEIKVLFTSGYTEEVTGQYREAGEKVNFIAKPFTPQALARKVREVLDDG